MHNTIISNHRDSARAHHKPFRGSNALRGFTLVELLVVIAIIGVLVAMLLPAVQAARESGNRTSCVNHLKQIGIAFSLHHDAHGFFPSGGWDWNSPPTLRSGSPAIGPEQKAGWAYQVLPYLEEESLWRSDPVTSIAAKIDVFFCPSRRRPQSVTFLDKYTPQVSGGMLEHGLCDYAAANREGTGAVRRYKPVRLAEVTDGVSKTMLAADKRMNLARLGEAQDDDNEGYTSGWNEDTIRKTTRVPEPDFLGQPIEDGNKRFGSSHSGVINVVMADSSVQQVGYDIEEGVFRRMGNRSDGDRGDVGHPNGQWTPQ